MKHLIVILFFALSATLCHAEDPPAYQTGQWYVWNATNAIVAQSALDYINEGSGVFPIYEKRRGQVTDKISTLRWAGAVMELKDGRLGFPRVPDQLLDSLGISEEQRATFWAAYSPEAVVVTSDMIKEEE